MMSFLRERTREGWQTRYGRANAELKKRAQRQIERELNLIERLNLAGYFLIVWDLVRFCREQKILVQGRGSAANSAVCYSLGITAVDPIGMELLFERFLSEERGSGPTSISICRAATSGSALSSTSTGAMGSAERP